MDNDEILAGILLPPCGGIVPEHKLAYWPISNHSYAFNCDGKRAIVGAQKEGKKWFVTHNQFIINNPLERSSELLKPPTDFWFAWRDGKVQPKSGRELFRELLHALGIFHDVAKPGDLLAQAATVATTWAWDWLSATHRLAIEANKNSGKSAQLETVAMLSLGGRFESNVSPAAVAWAQQNERISWFVDELDSLANTKGEEEHPLVVLLRQGYRRGATYSRASKDGGTPTVISISAPGGYTTVGSVDAMLESRSIKTEPPRSNDGRLPILNGAGVKARYLLRLKCEFYAWFLEQWRNPLPFPTAETAFPSLPQLDAGQGLDDARGVIFDEASAGFTQAELDFLKTFRARARELAYNLVLVGRVFGLEAGDYENLKPLLVETQREAEAPAQGTAAVVADVLAEHFAGKSIGETIAQSEIFSQVSSRVGYSVGVKKQLRLLREASVPAEAIVRRGAGRQVILTVALKAILDGLNVENVGNANNADIPKDQQNPVSYNVGILGNPTLPTFTALPTLGGKSNE